MGSCRQKSLPPPPCIFLTVPNSSGASSYGKKTNMGDAHLRQASNNIRRRSTTCLAYILHQHHAGCAIPLVFSSILPSLSTLLLYASSVKGDISKSVSGAATK